MTEKTKKNEMYSIMLPILVIKLLLFRYTFGSALCFSYLELENSWLHFFEEQHINYKATYLVWSQLFFISCHLPNVHLLVWKEKYNLTSPPKGLFINEFNINQFHYFICPGVQHIWPEINWKVICLFSFMRYAILYLKSKAVYSYSTLLSELRNAHAHDYMC